MKFRDAKKVKILSGNKGIFVLMFNSNASLRTFVKTGGSGH